MVKKIKIISGVLQVILVFQNEEIFFQLQVGTVNSKFHLIQSFCEFSARFLSFHVYNAQLIQTQLITSSTNLKGI